MDVILNMFNSKPWLCGPSHVDQELEIQVLLPPPPTANHQGEAEEPRNSETQIRTAQPSSHFSSSSSSTGGRTHQEEGLCDECLGPRPSEKAWALREVVSERLGFTPERTLPEEVDDETAPEVILALCVDLGLPLLELEPLVLPGFNVMTRFFSRKGMFMLLNLEGCSQRDPPFHSFQETIKSTKHFFGQLGKNDSNAPDLYEEPGLVCRMANWVELLDGVVLVGWLKYDLTQARLNYGAADDRFSINKVWMAALRRVQWSPQHCWVFPWWHQHRLAFVAWVGKQLGFGELWSQCVLVFLPIEPIDPSSNSHECELLCSSASSSLSLETTAAAS